MTKTLRVRSPHGIATEHGLAMEDSLGVTYAWCRLHSAVVAELVEQLNAAVDRGAPWPKYEAVPRRYD